MPQLYDRKKARLFELKNSKDNYSNIKVIGSYIQKHDPYATRLEELESNEFEDVLKKTNSKE